MQVGQKPCASERLQWEVTLWWKSVSYYIWTTLVWALS